MRIGQAPCDLLQSLVAAQAGSKTADPLKYLTAAKNAGTQTAVKVDTFLAFDVPDIIQQTRTHDLPFARGHGLHTSVKVHVQRGLLLFREVQKEADDRWVSPHAGFARHTWNAMAWSLATVLTEDKKVPNKKAGSPVAGGRKTHPTDYVTKYMPLDGSRVDKRKTRVRCVPGPPSRTGSFAIGPDRCNGDYFAWRADLETRAAVSFR
ncbi:hypothetical protein [Nonomuraea rhizosphaerae]|uniref:hypothetical protein n=1 Tax=Nonomuraea rhizosphaerae TaxID=2665663 RepID=UPI001C5E4386|nr:hypothetical protein [Nonomuraea rhizosphaerae]